MIQKDTAATEFALHTFRSLLDFPLNSHRHGKFCPDRSIGRARQKIGIGLSREGHTNAPVGGPQIDLILRRRLEACANGAVGGLGPQAPLEIVGSHRTVRRPKVHGAAGICDNDAGVGGPRIESAAHFLNLDPAVGGAKELVAIEA